MHERGLSILDKGLFEEVQRPPEALFGALVEVVAALQVEIVRGKVFDRSLLPAGLQQSGLKLLDNHLRDLLLRVDRVGEIGVHRFGPQVAAAGTIDQLGCHTHRIA